jgi:hypothetical protein
MTMHSNKKPSWRYTFFLLFVIMTFVSRNVP